MTILQTGLTASSGASSPEHGRFRPRFTLEQITRTVTLGHFAVSPDGRHSVYTVAGFYFGFPVIPRFGHDNNLRLARLDDGGIRRLTSGPQAKTRPVFSPDGGRVAYEAEGDIWIVDIADGSTYRVTTHASTDGDVAWSPTGDEIAFVSRRGGKVDLWVASVAGERHGLRRLTDDDARERSPDWSPDGEWVAYEARRDDEHFFASGIFSVAAGGGAPRRLTPVDEVTNSTPRWSPDGSTLAFLSDRSGFTHVWIARSDGGDAREIDTGPHDSISPHFEVEPVWSHDGSQILISANRGGSFDLAAVAVDAGTVEFLRAGRGNYRQVGWRRDGAPVFVHEAPWAPPDLYVGAADGDVQLTFSSHVAFRPKHFPRMKRVSLEAEDGLRLEGFLLEPSGLRDGEQRPAIVNLHTNIYGQFYDGWHPFFHYLAESGYPMLMADQRGSAGYGRAFRDAEVGDYDRGVLFDIEAMAAFLKSQPSVDPDRVAVMGLSHGGYRALFALTRRTEMFAAGIDLMGPTDRRRFVNRSRLFHIGSSPDVDPDLYRRISPIALVGRLEAPLLIIHSDADENVAPAQSYELADALDRHHKEFEMVVYQGEAHGLADPAHQLDSYRRILAFLELHIGR
ncbi:MAG TPA: S9 family peptidase [Acidobacteriota bacterium]|nr:S9 family peptidase [Acidobacteriota bacterium]